MTTFDKREKAFEDKFFNEEEKQFKITARTRKLLAVWAAQRMGKEEEASLSYAMKILEQCLTNTDEATFIDKINADFEASGIEIEPHKVAQKLAYFKQVATEQIEKAIR